MADDRAGVSTGPSGRPLNDTLAETGAGIPDDAVLDGELAPGELGAGADEAVEALERSGWTRPADASEPSAQDDREATEGQPS